MPSTQFGNVFEDIGDAVVDVTTSIIDKAGDAGHEIGSVLKGIAPIISMVPGIGTAVGVAFYAAGAIAAADKITDMAIGAASAAIPAGIPRIAFDGAVNVTRDISNGDNAFNSVVTACRNAASQAGGDKAVKAFDTGLAVARGERVSQSAIDAARANVASGGTSAVMAFDAAVGVARNEGADTILLTTARDYIGSAGGATALAAFDVGIAMGYGKTLQEAGFAGLHTFVKGNVGAEQVANFIEAIAKSKKIGVSVQMILTSDLTSELQSYLGTKLRRTIESVDVKGALKPYINAIGIDPTLMQAAPLDLVSNAGDEVIARAAQAIMRDGYIDPVTYELVTKKYVHLGKVKLPPKPTVQDKAKHLSTVLKQIEFDQTSTERLAMVALGRVISAADRKMLTDLALDGSIAAGSNSKVMAGRLLNPTAAYKWGFDVGTAASKGSTKPNELQQRVRNVLKLHDISDVRKDVIAPSPAGGFAQKAVRHDLSMFTGEGLGSPDSLKGFDVASAIQFALAKGTSSDADSRVAAGQLVTAGLAGSGLTADQKEGAMGEVIRDPLARAGAVGVIEEKKGFFTKILEFFGLG
jgi:hypothetical protein